MTPVPQGLGFGILRAFAGLTMAYHGWDKLPIETGFLGMVQRMGMPWPVASAWVAVISELVGGVLLAIGWQSRVAAGAILATLAVAIFGYHAGHAFAHRELALLYAAISLAVLVDGPGAVSVDAWWSWRRNTSRTENE